MLFFLWIKSKLDILNILEMTVGCSNHGEQNFMQWWPAEQLQSNIQKIYIATTVIEQQWKKQRNKMKTSSCVIQCLYKSWRNWVSLSSCFEFSQEEEGSDNKNQQESILCDAADSSSSHTLIMFAPPTLKGMTYDRQNAFYWRAESLLPRLLKLKSSCERFSCLSKHSLAWKQDNNTAMSWVSLSVSLSLFSPVSLYLSHSVLPIYPFYNFHGCKFNADANSAQSICTHRHTYIEGSVIQSVSNMGSRTNRE